MYALVLLLVLEQLLVMQGKGGDSIVEGVSSKTGRRRRTAS